jgi:hypothetical protein
MEDLKMNEEARLDVLEAVRRKMAAGAKKKQKAKKRNRAAPPIPAKKAKTAENAKTSLEKPSNPRALAFPNIEDGPRVPGRPLWMPEGLDVEKLPVEIRQAVAEIVQPAYEQMLLHAAPGLERSLGASLVHLLWLETLDQFDIKRDYATFDLALAIPGNRRSSVDHHIRLLDAKLRHGKFMLRLEEFRHHAGKSQPPQIEQQHPPIAQLASPLPEADKIETDAMPIAKEEMKAGDAPAKPRQFDETWTIPGFCDIPIPLDKAVR